MPPVAWAYASIVPLGDQAPTTASTSSGVSRCGVPPAAGTTQIDDPCAAPGGPSPPGGTFASTSGAGVAGWFRPREKAIHWPSGDHAAIQSCASSGAPSTTRRRSEPSGAIVQIAAVWSSFLMFWPTPPSFVQTVYAIRVPSGDQAGNE